MLDANDDAEDAVDAFDALITALSGADAFAAATEEDGDGVLEKAALSAEKAMEVFDAVTSMSAAALGTTENTRFGAYWQQEANIATDDLKHVDADQDTDPGEGNDVDDDETTDDLGKVGVFAYSVIDDVTKTIDLPTSGNLHYKGETVAVSGGESPACYCGEIGEIQVPAGEQDRARPGEQPAGRGRRPLGAFVRDCRLDSPGAGGAGHERGLEAAARSRRQHQLLGGGGQPAGDHGGRRLQRRADGPGGHGRSGAGGARHVVDRGEPGRSHGRQRQRQPRRPGEHEPADGCVRSGARRGPAGAQA